MCSWVGGGWVPRPGTSFLSREGYSEDGDWGPELGSASRARVTTRRTRSRSGATGRGRTLGRAWHACLQTLVFPHGAVRHPLFPLFAGPSSQNIFRMKLKYWHAWNLREPFDWACSYLEPPSPPAKESSKGSCRNQDSGRNELPREHPENSWKLGSPQQMASPLLLLCRVLALLRILSEFWGRCSCY